MPGYKKHLLFSAALFLPICYGMHLLHAPLLKLMRLLAMLLAGTLFPDVDTKSKGQKYFFMSIFLLLAYLIMSACFLEAALIGLVCTIPLLVRHRGLCHNPLFLICAPYLAWFVFSLYWPRHARSLKTEVVFFVIGAFLHIILDRVVTRLFSKA